MQAIRELKYFLWRYTCRGDGSNGGWVQLQIRKLNCLPNLLTLEKEMKEVRE